MSVQSGPSTGLMFFQDARTCKEWLKSIPITNIAQAQQTLLDALRLFKNVQIPPVEHLTCMELIRDKAAFLFSEQRARYAGRTVPISDAENTAWLLSRNLLEEMEAGYRRCWSEVAKGGELSEHAALIIQRIVRYIGLQMLIAGFVYRRFDPALWLRLHTQWLEAERRNLTEARVRDSVGATDGNSSILQAYTAVLLGQMANIYELTPRQIDFVDAVMKRLGHKVALGRDPILNPQGLVCTVDLLAEAGCGHHPQIVAGDQIRVLDMEPLAKSLRHRIRKLEEGEEPGAIELPADWSNHDALVQLKRLYKLWCEGIPPRVHAVAPEEAQAALAFGFADIHYFVSGNIFEQPSAKRELTRRELDDILMFGKVSEMTLKARYAGFSHITETWTLLNEGKGFIRLLRPAKSSHGVAIGMLVGVKIGNADVFYTGVIREIVQEMNGSIQVSAAVIPGKPEAIAVRSGDAHHRTSEDYVQGFRLPAFAVLNIPETLIVPSGLVPRGHGIDIFDPGQSERRAMTVQDFIERGMDFDRIAVL